MEENLRLVPCEYGEQDQTKLYPVKVEPKYYAAMRNDFITGKHGETTIRAAKFLRLMISQIVKEDRDFKAYEVPLADIARFWNISKNSLYRDTSDLCAQLVSSRLSINRGRGAKQEFIHLNIVSKAEYSRHTGKITFKFSEEIRPYLIGLGELYTQYQVGDIQNFRSYYSLRIYELLKCDYGRQQEREEFEYSVDFLRDFLECEDIYSTTAMFLKKTVEIAVKEINERTVLEVSHEYVKGKGRGTPVIAVVFLIKQYRSLELKQQFLAYRQLRDKGLTDKPFQEWRDEAAEHTGLTENKPDMLSPA